MIQMTREEYEKKYGVQPVFPSAPSINTDPAPIRMTRAEYEKAYAQPPATANERLAYTPPETALDRVKKGEAAFPADLDAGVSSNFARYVGNIPGSAYNLAKSINEINPFNPQFYVRSGSFVKDVANTVAEKGLLGTIGGVLKGGYEKWKQAGEDIYKNLEDNTVSEGSTAKGLALSGKQAVSKTAQAIIEDPLLVPSLIVAPEALGAKAAKGADLVSTIAKPVTKTADALIGTRVERKLNSAVKDFAEIEGKYAGGRKMNDALPDSGNASRKRIIESDVLSGAADSDGLIRTKQPGGAVSQYREKYIDGKESVVRDRLKEENMTISLPEIRKALEREVATSGLEGEALKSAWSGITRELEGLSMRADEFGNLPLSKIHDAKISTTNTIDYSNKGTAIYQKAKARAYRKLVEDKSNLNIKEINDALAPYYADIKRLEMLDGKRVKGGRLGNYFAGVTGNILGYAAGSVAGPVGGAIGSAIGGEVSRGIQGKLMSSTFGKPLNLSQETNAVLEKASIPLENGGLRVASPKVRAPRTGAEVSPTVSKLERKIADNVESQKKAIRKGDFTSVATLKEIYQALTDSLKAEMKR